VNNIDSEHSRVALDLREIRAGTTLWDIVDATVHIREEQRQPRLHLAGSRDGEKAHQSVERIAVWRGHRIALAAPPVRQKLHRRSGKQRLLDPCTNRIRSRWLPPFVFAIRESRVDVLALFAREDIAQGLDGHLASRPLGQPSDDLDSVYLVVG